MFEIVFLGTSASAPSIRRNLPSQVVMFGEHRFLVDCGEGTQRQILTSGIGFKRLNHIMITHSHLDHILGIAGLLSTFSRWESIEELNIYGGQAALDRIDALVYGVGVVQRGARGLMPINFHVLDGGPFITVDDLTISALPVRHRGPDCFSYIFDQKGRRPFLPEKAQALEIPPGPWRRDLVNEKSVTLPDGRLIEPHQVLGEFKPGSRLVITGDIGETDSLFEVCRGADLLVCESTYLEEEAEMAKQYGHLTARQAAELAKRAGVGQLVLTHLSRRYREKDVLNEAQSVFPDAVVARDFDVFRVKRGV